MADLDRRDAPFDGRWWLPDDPAEVVGGRLVLEAGSWRLDLFGWLGPYNDDIPYRDIPQRIVGRVGSTVVTLLGLSLLRLSSTMSDALEPIPYEAALSVHTVITGSELTENTLYSQVTVRMLNLNEWANRRPWSSENEPDEEHGTWRQKQIYTDPGWLHAELPHAKVHLFRLLGRTGIGSLSEVVMTSNEYIQFVFDAPLDLAAIEHDYVRPLKYFVQLASAAPSAVLELSLAVHGVPGIIENNHRRLSSCRVLSAVEADEDAETKGWFRFLFGLGGVAFDDIIPRWWALHAEIGPVSDLVAGLWDGSRSTSTRFLDAASAIEGYHRHKFPGGNSGGRRTSFAERVDAVLALAGPRFAAAVGDPVKWRDWVRDGRDSLAHRDPGMVDLEQEWRTTIGVANSMQLLLVLVLLADLAIPEEVLEQGLRQDRSLEVVPRYLQSVKPEWFTGS